MNDVVLDHLEKYTCPHCGEDVTALATNPFSTFECPGCKNEIPAPGQFGQFLLFERLSESITSALFRAYDPKLGRNVTLKILNYILSKNSELVDAFKREALAAAAMNSLYVLKVYELGTHNRQPYMVLEHIEGKFLNEVMHEDSLTESRMLDITIGIFQGLEDTHEQGIVHGDVMPRNILIHTDGTPRISDFGLARFSGEESDHLESWSSPYYMPPERVAGQPEDHRSDFYSLGTTLYYMLCGHLPYFDLEDDVVMQKKVSEDPPDPRSHNPDITPELAELSLLLLERNPDDRPATFDELRVILATVRESVPKDEIQISEPEEAPKPLYKTPTPSRKEPPWGIFLLLLVGILGAMLIAHYAKIYRAGAMPDGPPATSPTPAATPPPLTATTPTVTPVPLPTATPTPLPTPTPTPLPDPFRERILHADPDSLILNQENRITEWKDQLNPSSGFSQKTESLQPGVSHFAGSTVSVPTFERHRMMTTQTPHRNAVYSIVLLLEVDSDHKAETDQIVMGIDPNAPGERRFLIHLEKNLPGSFTFETEKGSARVALARSERIGSIPIALVRDLEEDAAYAGSHRVVLSGDPPVKPETDYNVLPTIQLGGLLDQDVFFQGRIAEIIFYERALSREEIRILFKNWKEQYREQP
jgi:serine/threonine-protein kinase